MKNQPDHNQQYQFRHLPERQKKQNPYTFWRITSQINRSNLLYFGSFFMQTILGLGAVLLSISGAIQPVLISVIMSILGSITSMFGIYCLYHVIQCADAKSDLIKQAIYRVVTFKN